MPFRDVPLAPRQPKSATHASVSIGRGGLRLGFSARLAGACGFAPGQGFGLQLGEGESAGLLRVVPAADGRKAHNIGRGCLGIGFGHVPDFAGIPPQKHYCAVQPDGTGLVVTLPRWDLTAAGADDGRHRFSFALDPDLAEALRDIATEADQEIPDFVAGLIGTFIEDWRRENGEAAP